MKIAKHCPNLNLFRCVYEYPADFPHWNPNQSLTDKILLAFAAHCPKLHTLAISKTSAMTSSGFIRLLCNSEIKLLDLHSTDLNAQGGVIGVLDDEFLLDLIPHLKNLSIINLFDQPLIDEQVFLKLFMSCPNLVSVCLNNTKITGSFLKKIVDIPALKLKRLSLFGCEGIEFEEIGGFCESLNAAGKSLDALYINPPASLNPLVQGSSNSNVDKPLPWSFSYVIFEDSWFVSLIVKVSTNFYS